MDSYSHNIPEFQLETLHLSALDRGIYHALLSHSYLTESPLPNDRDVLFRVCRAMTSDEQDAVFRMLNEFFVEDPGGWEHPRVKAAIKQSSAPKN